MHILDLGKIIKVLRSLDDDDLPSVMLNSGGQGSEMKITNEPSTTPKQGGG